MISNPLNTGVTEPMLKDLENAAGVLGLKLQIFNASDGAEIEAAFSAVARERAEALFVAPDALYNSRRVQFAILAARDRIPACYSNRDHVDAGGLMSYGTDIADSFRQVGLYVGKILSGVKPAENCRRCAQAPRFLNSILDPVSGTKHYIYRCDNCGEQWWQADNQS